jgi:DNA-binding response OmpR family regulator
MRDLVGKNILIVEGSLISTHELQETLRDVKARSVVAHNVNAAIDLLQRLKNDGVIVDQGLRNEAFEMCSECQERRIPYICCNAPHRLQGLTARSDDAAHTVWRLAHVIARAKELAFSAPPEPTQRELRAT